jgi:hypothetical protein
LDERDDRIPLLFSSSEEGDNMICKGTEEKNGQFSTSQSNLGGGYRQTDRGTSLISKRCDRERKLSIQWLKVSPEPLATPSIACRKIKWSNLNKSDWFRHSAAQNSA